MMRREDKAEAEEVRADRGRMGLEFPVSIPMDVSRCIRISPQGLSTVCPAHHALHCCIHQ
jgi:hypothetical protein